MSALNVCHKPDRLVVMQDAAVYASDGTILSLDEKGVVLEGKNLFIAACGPAASPAAFADLVNEWFDDIDEVGDEGESYMQALFDGARDAGFVDGVVVVVGGWSQRHNRPRGVSFSAGLPNASGFLGDIGSAMHPALKGQFLQRWRMMHGIEDIHIGRFDPMKDGIGLMEMQREQPCTAGDCEGHFIVGGHVKLTEIYHDRIEQRIVKRWAEDEPGSRINPVSAFSTLGNVTPIAPAIAFRGMNRAERRRAEKLGKRRSAA